MVLHPERVHVVEKKDQRKNLYLSLRLAHSDFASRASSPKLDCADVLSVCTIHMITTRRYSLGSTRSPLLHWPAGPTATPSAQHALRTCTGQKDYHAAFPSPRPVSRSALLFAPCTRPPMQLVRPSSAIFPRRSPRTITRLWFRPLCIGLHLSILQTSLGALLFASCTRPPMRFVRADLHS